MATLTPSPKMQFFDTDGEPLVGGKLYTYAAGTTTPLTTYTNSGAGTPNTNPIILDSRGEANVWLGSSLYKFVLKDSNDVAIFTVDNIGGITTLNSISASTGASIVGFIQSGAGAVARTVQSKLRDFISVKDFGAVGDGVTDDTSAIQAACTAAYNGGSSGQKTVFFPSGTYLVTNTITVQCSIVGDGPFENNTGTIIKWTGSASKVFEIPTYVSGWLFQGFRIDTQSVTTDVSMMYFSQGLVGARFVDVEFRGYHTGSSFGGTYKNHDGIYIVGGSGVTKYDTANSIFEHVFFTRCRNGITVTDPSSQGPGSSLVFANCFSWCNGWTAKLPGANNVFINFETVAESGNHTFVMDGQFAIGWSFIGCDFDTAASGAGNQILYGNTSGGGNLATFIGGTLQPSNGGGLPGLVRDAGATGGKVFRYMVQGMNNFNSTVLTVDQLDIGQSSARANQFFYDEGTWTPTWTGLSVVGTPSYSGQWTLCGNLLHWTVKIVPSGGSTTASTAGTTFINNMPFVQTGIAVTCTASNAGTLASYGVGQGAVGGKSMFTPTWAAAAEGITISGHYFTDGST